MAVPKKKTSKSRGKMRRSHWKVSAPGLSVDKKSGLFVMPHRVCPTTGMYKGKRVVNVEEI
ncbi:MAG: 50S ribosomal protein L32 [Deltaproteobacteria bacterium CG11_big_fil_rev_8_21_14_0_20_45_16]|nr:MAG: 50S ribosomal protein L32 [Deltaproteobacteria bacterium CG11_big_fil_rev_8_21_14_0_20_45_16]